MQSHITHIISIRKARSEGLPSVGVLGTQGRIKIFSKGESASVK